MKILEIRKNQILELCKYLRNEYDYILTNSELEEIIKIYDNLEKIDIIDFNLINMSTTFLLPIVQRVWEEELNSNEYIVISWNKHANKIQQSPVTFATLSRKNNIISFCGLTEGTEYEINFSSLIGCLNKDGATLIEDESKRNEFTIASIGNKVINSYNGATKLITPKQLLEQTNNDYHTNYNELILDSALIKEIGPYEIKGKRSRK